MGSPKNLLVIDGQGGNIGRQVIEAVLKNKPAVHLVAVGTNSAATANMLKGGAALAATGENAVRVHSRRADVIVGPIGIIIADALLGETTPTMALAVAQSDAKKILIPVNRCETLVAGTMGRSLGELIEDAVQLALSALTE